MLEEKVLVNHKNECMHISIMDIVSEKIVALFFSAGWCPPCRGFVPQLVSFYGELKHRCCPFEVIYVSADRDEKEMTNYAETQHADWLTIPFGNPLISELQKKYAIELIPKVIVIHKNGDVISSVGRKEIEDKGVSAFRKWQAAAQLTTRQQPGIESRNAPAQLKEIDIMDSQDGI